MHICPAVSTRRDCGAWSSVSWAQQTLQPCRSVSCRIYAAAKLRRACPSFLGSIRRHSCCRRRRRLAAYLLNRQLNACLRRQKWRIGAAYQYVALKVEVDKLVVLSAPFEGQSPMRRCPGWSLRSPRCPPCSRPKSKLASPWALVLHRSLR